MNATPESASPRDDGPKFEAAMARLEEIVHALEAGNLSLDDSLRVFEEGTGLLRLCTRRLEEAERRTRAAAGRRPTVRLHEVRR